MEKHKKEQFETALKSCLYSAFGKLCIYGMEEDKKAVDETVAEYSDSLISIIDENKNNTSFVERCMRKIMKSKLSL